MKIAIITAVWKRPEIFNLFAAGVQKLIKDFPHVSIECFVAGSEGEASKQMVTQHPNFYYVEVPNDPLAEKHNASLRLALTHKPNYVICLGSDDVISPALFQVYLDEIERGMEVVLFKDFYFYDLVSGRASYWGGYTDYRAGRCIGAGAMIHSRLLDIWMWKIWRPNHNKILDNSLHDRIQATPCKQIVLSLKEKGVYAVDLKSHINMTPFELWPNTVEIPPQELRDAFPYLNLPIGNKIHPSAHIHPDAKLGDGNTIMEGAIIREGVTMGDGNYVGPYCILGDVPEKVGWFDKPAGVEIGNNNRFTKQVTIDSGTTTKTIIGNNNIYLKNSHQGHDATVMDNNVFSCNSMIGGWCEISNHVNLGLGAAIHQRKSIPQGVIIGMNSTVVKDSKLDAWRKYAGSPVKDVGSNAPL